MFNTDAESNADQDLGSGGELLLPDLKDAQQNTWHLAVGAGKDGHIYLANRDMMGKFNTSNDSGIYQEVSSGGLGGGVWSSPAYWNNTLYYGAVNDTLRAFTITNAKIVTPAATQSPDGFRLSRYDAEHFCEWQLERDRVGDSEQRHRRIARLRCHEFGHRAVQQRSSGKEPRHVRR